MPELTPLPVLFGNPERVSPNISPDGTQLAWIAPHEGVLNVSLAPVSAQEGADLAAARVITDDTDRGIRQFGWAHTAATCSTCRTLAATRTSGCTTSTSRPWSGGT